MGAIRNPFVMRNIVKILGIVALLVIAGFMFVSCDMLGPDGIFGADCHCDFGFVCDCVSCFCELGAGCACDGYGDFGDDSWLSLRRGPCSTGRT